MNHLDLLASEAHRLLDVHMRELDTYHRAPVNGDEHKLALAKQHASMRAVDIVVNARTRVAVYGTPCEEALRRFVLTEQDKLVREHLEDVLAKLPTLQEHATNEACASLMV